MASGRQWPSTVVASMIDFPPRNPARRRLVPLTYTRRQTTSHSLAGIPCPAEVSQVLPLFDMIDTATSCHEKMTEKKMMNRLWIQREGKLHADCQSRSPMPSTSAETSSSPWGQARLVETGEAHGGHKQPASCLFCLFSSHCIHSTESMTAP